MIQVSLNGNQQIIERLRSMPQNVWASLYKEVTKLAIELRNHVVKDKLSGQVLNVQTGNLRRSIFYKVERTDHSVIGRVYSSADVKYAGIHEFGGMTGAHDIYPVKAQALAFLMGGKQVFAKVVHHPGSRMPERSFLRSSLDDYAGKIIAGMREAVVKGMHE